MANLKDTRSKVLSLAHKLKASGLSFGEAQKKAWKVIRLKEAMQNDIVEFTFIKKDGSLRAAKGTTSNQFFTYEKKTDRTTPSHLVTYFDIEKQSFRCFKAANLVA